MFSTGLDSGLAPATESHLWPTTSRLEALLDVPPHPRLAGSSHLAPHYKSAPTCVFCLRSCKLHDDGDFTGSLLWAPRAWPKSFLGQCLLNQHALTWRWNFCYNYVFSWTTTCIYANKELCIQSVLKMHISENYELVHFFSPWWTL